MNHLETLRPSSRDFFFDEQLRDLQLTRSPFPFLFLEERVFNMQCTSAFNPVSLKPCVSLHFKLNYTRTPSRVSLAHPLSPLPFLPVVSLWSSSIFLSSPLIRENGKKSYVKLRRRMNHSININQIVKNKEI